MLYDFKLQATWKTHFTFFLSHTLSLDHPQQALWKPRCYQTWTLWHCLSLSAEHYRLDMCFRRPTQTDLPPGGGMPRTTHRAWTPEPHCHLCWWRTRGNTPPTHMIILTAGTPRNHFFFKLAICCVSVCVCVVNVSQIVTNRSQKGQQQATTGGIPSRYCSTYLCRYSSQNVCGSSLACMVILHKCGCLSRSFLSPPACTFGEMVI